MSPVDTEYSITYHCFWCEVPCTS